MNLAWIHLALFSLTALFALLETDPRFRLVAIAIQYTVLFWVVSTSLSLGLALVKLIVGWTAIALLGASLWNEPRIRPASFSWSQQVFRLLGGGMIIGLSFSFSSPQTTWLPVEMLYLRSGITLAGCGLLMNGFSRHSSMTILSLLEILSGFELIYAFLVDSVLMTGMLALVTLGLAGVGAYLTFLHSLPEGQR